MIWSTFNYAHNRSRSGTRGQNYSNSMESLKVSTKHVHEISIRLGWETRSDGILCCLNETLSAINKISQNALVPQICNEIWMMMFGEERMADDN